MTGFTTDQMVSRLLNEAMLELQADRIQGAETLIGEVLSRSPNDADALHLMGVCHYRRGDGVAALAVDHLHQPLLKLLKSARG